MHSSGVCVGSLPQMLASLAAGAVLSRKHSLPCTLELVEVAEGGVPVSLRKCRADSPKLVSGVVAVLAAAANPTQGVTTESTGIASVGDVESQVRSTSAQADPAGNGKET